MNDKTKMSQSNIQMINLFPINHVIKFSILKEMGITYNAPTFEFHLLYKFASKYQGDQDVRGISIKCREFCMSQYIYISLYYPYGCCVGGEIWNFFFFLMLDLYSLIVVRWKDCNGDQQRQIIYSTGHGGWCYQGNS